MSRDDADLDRILEIVQTIDERTQNMAIDQDQFDTDLAALVAAIGNLVTAVDALIASKPAADLTAEDQSVQAAAATVQTELTKITPAP